MTIDRLNSLDPLQPKRTTNTPRAGKGARGDSVSLSSEAIEKAELYQAMELAKAAPEERADRIAELRAKINDPDYLNDAVLSATADRILDQLL
ncbi:MAG: flagellar biosynthesis protein FlgM [Spirochaetes bacterium GWD1_61_31]|nr:MAG: flagellar biosynthesis protein FlgM [Spirochaetes bacterium GWB1_60_80]OHD35521.1 MAG: flagellar biosynthesis protein FlgM [Spirochaetes bacterium GWC1_61_12]OHD38996.1 MAG: flagellar biosynthesis protein FlgM [Spirochaetes bacterium GWD1_61_31]OHD43495.1 MAG: flagellar biosynthesis protein FlgM [Spirochaetes bacterium GWE1_60_18]OHD60758.1 MAG: flagellar biosynthesis protein FlgM [Spirochaetes bacterium GWF1_60_12]HAW86432.1 flagellar biosynthesis protein FlgM [Spirochaetaceae bacteri